MLKFRKKSIHNENENENEIQEFYNKKEYDNVISSYKSFLTKTKKPSTRIKQMVALAYYYNKDFENSLHLFEEINSIKTETESSFNVLMSLLALGEMDKAREVFDKTIKSHKGLNPKQARELSIPYIKYYYAYGLADNGLFEDALIQLNDLTDIYVDIKETDDTFLYIRGIPFLTQSLDLADKIFCGLKLDLVSSDFILKLKKSLDHKGKQKINEYLENKKLKI